MISLITAALGFAALENSLFLFQVVTDGAIDSTFLLTGHLRFLGANIVHVVASAVVGGVMGLAFCYRRWPRLGCLLLGLCTATLLHALFNLLIIISDGDQLFKILALLWLFAVLIILLFEKVKTIQCLKTSDLSSNG